MKSCGQVLCHSTKGVDLRMEALYKKFPTAGRHAGVNGTFRRPIAESCRGRSSLSTAARSGRKGLALWPVNVEVASFYRWSAAAIERCFINPDGCLAARLVRIARCHFLRSQTYIKRPIAGPRSFEQLAA